MSIETYLYTAFSNGINIDLLKSEIALSAISATRTSIDRDATSIQIGFSAGLSAGEKIILDGIVSTHNPANLVDNTGSTVLLTDERTIGTNGDTFNSGTWMTRTLNTIVRSDNINIFCTLAANQFTLKPGSYQLRTESPAHRVGHHCTRIQDITNNVTIATSVNSYSFTGNQGGINESSIITTVNPTVDTVYELQHICDSTRLNDGMGKAAGFGTETYARVFIQQYI